MSMEVLPRVWVKDCGNCGKQFERNDHRFRYCSLDCSKWGQRRKVREWRAVNHDRMKRRSRERYRINAAEHSKRRKLRYATNPELRKRLQAYARDYYWRVVKVRRASPT